MDISNLGGHIEQLGSQLGNDRHIFSIIACGKVCHMYALVLSTWCAVDPIRLSMAGHMAEEGGTCRWLAIGLKLLIVNRYFHL